jgi:hypothetical protein
MYYRVCLKGSVVDPDPDLFGSGIMVLNQDTDPDLIFLTCIFFHFFLSNGRIHL